jgi:hypothetical protein
VIPLLIVALALSVAVAAREAHRRADEHLAAARAAHQAADARLAVQQARAASSSQREAAKNTSAAATAASTDQARADVVASAAAVTAREEPLAEVTTEAHLASAQAASDADTATEHVAEAQEANRAEAERVAAAAAVARTEADRALAAERAARVLERDQRIDAALAKLGVGQCGVRSYAGVTESIKDAILSQLRKEGMFVRGDNPWDIDSRKAGVKLRALWDPRSEEIKLIVTAGKGNLLGMVTCDKIWAEIEPALKKFRDASTAVGRGRWR